MTLEEHLKLIIGDLTIRVAQLSAELDALKAKLPPPEA
jgi:hypothetical protein